MKILLTNRALADLGNIYDFSKKNWGKKKAEQYIKSIEDSITLLGKSPNLLAKNESISKVFFAFRVQEHWLICDKRKKKTFILTVIHSSMNVLERLKELSPNFDLEVKALNTRLKK